MRLKTLTILLLICFFPLVGSYAQVKKLSETAKISLLTCGPGEPIYSKYGHSALWVFDPAQRIDRVYNYGTFDFYSNKFYLEFIKGTALYNLSVSNFQRFYLEYEGENRSIAGQELNLTPAERQYLFELLEENYKPENRHYLYDFLFQNCSSLIRDIVWKATSGRYSIPEASETKHSFRSMMIPYLSKSPWLMNGMFLVMSHRSDREANPWDQMYLPDYMYDWFDAAINQEGESLVSKSQTLFLPQSENKKKSFLTHPNFILALILLLVLWLTFREVKYKRTLRPVDSVLFFFSGIMGILMIYMWCCSKHLVTHQNLNLMWAFPLHFLVAIMIWIRGTHPYIRLYARIMAPIALVFLCFSWILPQTIPFAAVLASAIISIRLIRWAFFPLPNGTDN